MDTALGTGGAPYVNASRPSPGSTNTSLIRSSAEGEGSAFAKGNLLVFNLACAGGGVVTRGRQSVTRMMRSARSLGGSWRPVVSIVTSARSPV